MKKVTLLKTLLKISIICVFILIIGDDDCGVCYTTYTHNPHAL